jgi:hypothetical protein
MGPRIAKGSRQIDVSEATIVDEALDANRALAEK